MGTVSSGVVSYPITIQLDNVDDSLIFPNMSATANIITDFKDNVLLIPSSALKTSDGTTTVEILENGKKVSKSVEVGLRSDSQVEIISGINEGDEVITSTITKTTKTRTTQTTSPFGSLGGNIRVGSGSMRP
jgi:multidrug efflux pump subunit AcrA (membrane-fusion protein)